MIFSGYSSSLDERKRMGRAKMAVSSLVRCTLQICKKKSAAIHFETDVALVSVMGADAGHIQLSRKHFPGVIATVAEEIDHQINAMTSPPPFTGLPPHWWCTMDKSTPGHIPIK